MRAPTVEATLPEARTELAWVIGGLVLVWAILFAPQLFGARVFVLGDAAAFRPLAEFSRARWLDLHQRTFWNPYVFMGLPATSSLADPRPQYLPDATLDLLEGLHRLPHWPPLAAPILAHLVGMLAAALLVRALWRVGAAAMLWSGWGWGLMPNLLVPLAFGHDSQFASAALIPAVMLAVHHLFAAETRLLTAWAALALAVTLGVQCLAGHPQIMVYSAAMAIAFAIERAWHFGRSRRPFVALGAGVLGAALAAAVWWPALLYSIHSSRGGSGVPLAQVADFSHAPRDLLALAWPWAVGFGGSTYWGGLRMTDYPQYLGITVMAVAIGGWRGSLRRDRRADLVFLGALVVAVMLSLGTHLGALYAFAHAHVPPLSRFRVPVAIMIIAQLSLALLSARGFERLFHGSGRRAIMGPQIALASALALGILGLMIAFGPLRDTYVTTALRARPELSYEAIVTTARRAGVDLTFRAAWLGALAALLMRSSPRGRLRLVPSAAAALIVIGDLGSVSAPLLRRASGAIERLSPPPPPPLARVAAADPLGRALPLTPATLLSNDWVAWRAHSIGGNHAAVPSTWDDLMSHGLLGRYPALCALAVRYVAGDSAVRVDTSRSRPVFLNGAPTGVLRLPDAMPRAYAVPRVRRVAADAEVIAALFADDFDPRGAAFTTDAAAEGEYPGAARGTLRWVEDSPDHVVLDTQAPARLFVVVADSYFPGWEARVDGVRTRLFRVDHAIRGIAVPTGAHRVTLDYRPEGWGFGVAATRVTIATLVAIALGLVFATARPRRRTRSVGLLLREP